MHDERSIQFVGDADSSVFANIKQHGVLRVRCQKIECVNYTKELWENATYYKKDTQISFKGRELLTNVKC